MAKKSFYSKIAYAIALVLLALGTALTAKSDLGISIHYKKHYRLLTTSSQCAIMLTNVRETRVGDL